MPNEKIRIHRGKKPTTETKLGFTFKGAAGEPFTSFFSSSVVFVFTFGSSEIK